MLILILHTYVLMYSKRDNLYYLLADIKAAFISEKQM
jgi:hypothetical protein